MKKKKQIPIVESPVLRNVEQDDSISKEIPKKSPTYIDNLFWLFLKAAALTFLFLGMFLLITASVIGLIAYKKARSFSDAAGVTLPQLFQIAQEGWDTTPVQTNNRINILILGTDHVANRGNTPVLTDTIMLASLNLKTGQVSMFSLPRDLWHVSYDTRINALYTYGKDRYPSEPERFTREVVQEITGVQIHHTLVIGLDTLSQLVDEVGGVDIDVKEGFIDTQFPRSDVDVAKVHDPRLLFETVEFKPGVQTLTGERVLQYVRSRHSGDDQGTDNARSNRQQEVISALIAKLKDVNFYRDLPRLGRLYSFYNDHFGKIIPVQEAIGILHALVPVRNQINISEGAPSIFPQDPQGVITHPPVQKYKNQWVYEIRDGQVFQTEVQQKLHF